MSNTGRRALISLLRDFYGPANGNLNIMASTQNITDLGAGTRIISTGTEIMSALTSPVEM